MKSGEIKVGGTYEAMVSNRLVIVRVDAIRVRDGHGYSPDRTVYDITNLSTGRKIVFASAAKFRREMKAPVTQPVPKESRTMTREELGLPMPSAGKLVRITCPECGGNPDGEDECPTCGDWGSINATDVRHDRLMVNPAPPIAPTPAPRSFGTASTWASSGSDLASHLIVEARAGTGKTTTLVQGIRLVMGLPAQLTPSSQQAAVWESMKESAGKVPNGICFVAFNKSIATELQARVPQGCDAMTMHSMGYKAVLKTFGGVKVESYRVGAIISELLGQPIKDLLKKKPNVVQSAEKLVGLCKMNLISPESMDVEQLDTLVAHYDIDLNGDKAEVYELVPKVLARCLDVSKDRMIDFNDMIWLPVVLNMPLRRYSLLLIDEAQDLNRCQQALAKRAGDRLILCGDPKQAIYGFAGADSESMSRMGEELGETGRGCKTLPLTVTRRCGKAIVAEARKIVSDFEAFETNCEGTVMTMKYEKGKSLKKHVASCTCESMDGAIQSNPSCPAHDFSEVDYTDLVKDGDFILCRVNAPLVSQCFRFLRQGRKANIQGRDIGQGLVKLVNKMKAERVVDLIPKLEEYFSNEERKENAKKFPSEARLIALADRKDCLMFFCEGFTFVSEVTQRIESIFTDDKTSPGVKLSSIHKAKGLESRTVFFINHKDAPCPHPMASTEWQQEQEMNLKYVGITRAIETLVWVC